MDFRLKSEPLINPKIILVAVIVTSCLVYFSVELLHLQWVTISQTISYTLLISLLTIIGWLLTDRHPLIGRWFTILLLSLTVHLWGAMLELPGALSLAAVTVAFAVPLLGIAQATIVTLGESILLIILASTPTIELSSLNVIPALIVIWAEYAVMFATNQKFMEKNSWFTEYFNRTQELLDEARDHRAELVQTLDDLAHVNRQMAMLNKRVNDLRIIAEEAQKSKTRFVARVSHEFRTPLNMIIGLTDLIIETPEIYDATLSPRMRDALQIVHRNSRHLSDMVNDVLDLSRIETERMVLNKERVDIQGIVDAAVEAVRPLLESKKIGMILDVAQDLPQVYCDKTRIEQVILNLVSNSARHTKKGQITITAVRRDQNLQVSVHDTGLGISKEDLKLIFEPFSQGTGEFVDRKGGSGLGLSISKQFIGLHNGRMWVESDLGVGSTFTFEIPISLPLEPIGRPGHQIAESWIWRERRTRTNLPDMRTGPRVLVYDETEDLSGLLARYSGEIDFVKTPNGKQIIDELRQTPANAVLLNVSDMGKLLSLVEMLKQEANGTPIIGCNIPRRLDRAKSMGLLGQLIKPVTRADIQHALTMVSLPVRRVLVVDDDPEVIDLFSQMLRVCDPSLEIGSASNGTEALSRVREQAPDLLLLDLMMPGIDGWQVLETMFNDRQIPKVPIFFVSAQDPYDQPLRSDFLYVATKDGLSIHQILRSSLELSNLLLRPEVVSDQALV